VRGLGPRKVELFELAGLDQLGYLVGQALAYARQFGQIIALLDPVGQRIPEVTDGTGAVAIGTDAVRIAPLDLEEVGDAIEGCRDAGVVQYAPPWTLKCATSVPLVSPARGLVSNRSSRSGRFVFSVSRARKTCLCLGIGLASFFEARTYGRALRPRK